MPITGDHRLVKAINRTALLRLLPDGTIGRVSVLKDWRGLKGGDALMRYLARCRAGARVDICTLQEAGAAWRTPSST